MINFAHGEVFMAGVFTAFFTATALADSGILETNPIVGLAVIFATAMATSMIVAILLERIAYRPLRRAPRLVPLITAIGASLFLQYTFRGLFGSGVRSYPTIEILTGTVNILGLEMLKTQLVVIVAAVVLMGGLYVFIQRTRTGRAMRAVSEDKDVAAMMGIDVDRVISTTFAIGGLLAGATGILYVMLFNVVSFSMGFLPGIKAFTAAVLGGIGNIVGRHARRHPPRAARVDRPPPAAQWLRRAFDQPASRRGRVHGARPRPDLPALRDPGAEGVSADR